MNARVPGKVLNFRLKNGFDFMPRRGLSSCLRNGSYQVSELRIPAIQEMTFREVLLVDRVTARSHFE